MTTTTSQEWNAFHTSTGMYQHESYGHLLLEGPDSTTFLQRLTSNDVVSLGVDQGQYNALLDRKGMVASLFYLLRLSEEKFCLFTPPQLTQKTQTLLSKMKFREKLTITDISKDRCLVKVIGPTADAVHKTLFLSDPKFEDGDGGHRGEIELSPRFEWREETYGPPCWNISMPLSELSTFLKQDKLTFPLLSDETFQLIRMEACVPEYGVDVDETHILLEIQRPIAYKRQKGCYPGQEVVEKILTYGKGRAPKTLVRFSMEGKQDIFGGTEIFSEKKEPAGNVTSALFHPLENKTIVLGYLAHKFLEEKNFLIQHQPAQVFVPSV